MDQHRPIQSPRGDMNRLQEVFDWLPLPGGKTLHRLLDQGVPFDSLYVVRGAWVTFDSSTTFDFDVAGEPALILRCDDQGETIDLAAWGHDGRLATWRGAGVCIGDLDDCFNPASWFAAGGLRVHCGPRQWLQAGCEGIVILAPRLCWAYLRHVPRIICADIETGDVVRRWNRPPQASTEILIDRDDAVIGNGVVYESIAAR